MILLIVTVTVKPGRRPDYVSKFLAMAPHVRLEPGCLEYDIYQDSTDARFDNVARPDTVVLCEKWDSIESLQAHTRHSAALDEFRSAVRDIKVESTYRLLVPGHAKCRQADESAPGTSATGALQS